MLEWPPFHMFGSLPAGLALPRHENPVLQEVWPSGLRHWS